MGSIKNILLVGASGFLGSHILKSLIENGFVVTILKREETNIWRIKDLINKVKIYNASFDIDLNLVLKNNEIDCIINTATEYGFNKDLSTVVESNILLPIKLLDAAQKNGLKLFINTDSFFTKNQNEYDYLNHYTLSKKILQSFLKMYSLNIANMQLEHIFGENDSNEKFVTKTINSLINNDEFVNFTAGLQKRDFIYVNDVVDAYLAVIKNHEKVNGLQTYEIGTGKSITIKEFVEKAHLHSNSTTNLNFGALPTRKGEFTDSFANKNFCDNFNWYASTSLDSALRKIIQHQKQLPNK